MPTRQWPAGVVIVDRHPLTLDLDAPAGEYEIEIGLYNTATGERLSVAGEGADAGGAAERGLEVGRSGRARNTRVTEGEVLRDTLFG